MYNKKGFTLVEMLIAMSIFTLAAVMASQVLTDTVRFQRQARIRNQVFNDVQFVMDTLSKEISSQSIDYEEYYSKYVLQDDPNGSFGGINYGVYGSRFFNPGGDNSNTNPDDLGAVCSVLQGAECETYITESFDFSEGKNPYFEKNSYEASAFCEGGRGLCVANRNAPAVVEDLFLISNDGQEKTLISKRLISRDGAEMNFGLGKVMMEGKDLDQNGIVETFSCMEGYLCEEGENVRDIMERFPFINGFVPELVSLPYAGDLLEEFDPARSHYVPITPLAINVKEVQFRIRPLDDPYKAFAERVMQMQPAVEIEMVFGLNSKLEKDYPGRFEDFRMKTVVSSGTQGHIPSYPPVDDNLNPEGANVPSWIAAPDVLPAVLHE